LKDNVLCLTTGWGSKQSYKSNRSRHIYTNWKGGRKEIIRRGRKKIRGVSSSACLSSSRILSCPTRSPNSQKLSIKTTTLVHKSYLHSLLYHIPYSYFRRSSFDLRTFYLVGFVVHFDNG